MTKEYWLFMRSQENFPVELIFAFYKEQGGYIEDIQTFHDYLFKMCLVPKVINSKGDFVRITHETIIHKIHKYYDHKFGLCMT